MTSKHLTIFWILVALSGPFCIFVGVALAFGLEIWFALADGDWFDWIVYFGLILFLGKLAISLRK